MANEENLAILKQAVAAWKQQREENPSITPNLRATDAEYYAQLRKLVEALNPQSWPPTVIAR